MLSLFDPDVFHMGGDEVSYPCWMTLEIRFFMEVKNITELMELTFKTEVAIQK